MQNIRKFCGSDHSAPSGLHPDSHSAVTTRVYTRKVNRRLITGCAIALTMVACGSASAPVATPTTRILVGNGFSALYPVSWSLKTITLKGATEYQLSSHGSLTTAGVPIPGAIGITIQAVPYAAAVAAGLPNPATMTPTQLVDRVIGTPTGATDVKVVNPPHVDLWLNDTAYGLSLTYATAGTPNLQEDLIDRHTQAIYLIELDTEPTLQTPGEAALKTVTHSWGWATP